MEERSNEPSPWHEGERAAQMRAGVAERMAVIGRRNIRSFMPDQHRQFFTQLPFVLVGSVDAAGWPWASVLTGLPGFVRSPDPVVLELAAHPVPGDPLERALAEDKALAILGIELPTRRRNRANGRVVNVDAEGFSVVVDQSFGNCPQYIQRRAYVELHPIDAVHVEPFTGLAESAADLIRSSDTFFVATAASRTPDARHGVDISHRGGRPGFVGVKADGTLVVPDYLGNRYFQTIGNMLVNPRAGLLFIDFARGDLLQVTGTTELVWEGPEVAAFQGAERMWRLRPERGQWLHGAWTLRVDPRDPSPQALATGTWAEAQTRLAAPR